MFAVFTVVVNGYVASQANLNHGNPVLCLTDVEILHTAGRTPTALHWHRTMSPIWCNNNLPGEAIQVTQGRVLGGKIADFLAKIGPCLPNKALAGGFVQFYQDEPSIQATQHHAKIKVVSDFMSTYSAMNTLHRASVASLASSNSDHDSTGERATESVSAPPVPTGTEAAEANLAAAPPVVMTKLYMSVLESFAASQLDRDQTFPQI